MKRSSEWQALKVKTVLKYIETLQPDGVVLSTLSDRVIPTGITNFLTSSASINSIKCLIIPFGVIKS